MVLEQIKENDEDMPPNGDRAPSVKMSASNEKKVPEVSTQDEKNVFKKLAEIFAKNKRQGQSAVSFDEIFEVFQDMDKLYLEAVLAVIEQKGNIFIDQESKTILMI